MRFVQSAILLVAIAVAVPSCSIGDSVESPAVESRSSRTFQFTYAATIPAAPAGTRELTVWLPLPQVDPGVQSVANLEISAPGEYEVRKESVYGNRMVHLTVTNPDTPQKVSWTATITRTVDSGQSSLPACPQYSQANRLIPIDGDAREIAATLGVDDDEKPIHWRAKRIFGDVLEGMEYNKKVEGYGFGNFHRAITVCKGNCTDFHARFIGVARAAGIPVRFTMGIPMKSDPTGSYNSYHCWAHYHDGRNWHPIDISEADKVVGTDPEKAAWFFRHIDQDRVGLSYGRDIVLSPPQKSAPLNYFVFPHAEADGQPMKLDKSMWQFSYADVSDT